MYSALDDRLVHLCKALGRSLEPRIRAAREAKEGYANTDLRIDLNDRVLTLSTRARHGKPLDISEAELSGAGLPDLVDALRSSMPGIAWPITLHLEIQGLDRHGSSWPQVSCTGLGAANWQMTHFNRSSPLLKRGRGSFSCEGGLDAIAEGLQLVSEVCPPTNREVRSWSSLSYLMSEFCHNENIHARSEAEFLLKIRLFHEGLEAIREVAETGIFKPRNNEDGLRFTSIELEGLDEDPRGRRLRSSDVFAALAGHLAGRLKQDEGFPSP